MTGSLLSSLAKLLQRSSSCRHTSGVYWLIVDFTVQSHSRNAFKKQIKKGTKQLGKGYRSPQKKKNLESFLHRKLIINSFPQIKQSSLHHCPQKPLYSQPHSSNQISRVYLELYECKLRGIWVVWTVAKKLNNYIMKCIAFLFQSLCCHQ